MITNAEIAAMGADVREYLLQPACPECGGGENRTGCKRCRGTGRVVRGDPAYEQTRSGLVQFGACPVKWLATEESAAAELGTKAQDWGTALDCLTLDESRVEDRLAVYPETYPCEPTKADPRTEKPWNNNATFCKAWNQQAEEAGKLCFKVEVFNALRLAAQRLRDDARIAAVLEGAQYQVWVRGQWQDQATGLIVPIKTLIDIVPAAGNGWMGESLADLKTARNASPWAWEGICFDGGYHVQGSLALALYNAVPGVQKRHLFLHVISENEPPYQTGRRVLGAELLNMAGVWWQSQMARYCQCLKTGHWPDYETGPDSHDGWTVINPKPWREQAVMESLPAVAEARPDADLCNPN